MRKRFNLLPTYHFEENTDGQIRGAAERVLRDCTIYGNCGKNLLPYPFKDTTKTINGITFTDNGNGTVTANGTATDTTQFFPKESLDGPLLAPGESISCREKSLSVPELATIDPNITNYITFGSEVKLSSAKFDYYKY